MDVRDVGVVQRSEDLRFTLEPAESFRISRQRGRQYFDRDLPFQARVGRAIHLPHTAGPESRDNLVRSQACAGSERRGRQLAGF